MKEKIKAIRHRLNLTQEHFAHLLGVSVTTVNRWENNHSQPSGLARKLIVGICERRNIAVDDALNLIDEIKLTSTG